MNNCVNNWGGLWQLLEMEKSMLSQICCLHVWPFCEVTRKAAGFDGGGVGGFSYSLWVASFGILLAEWVQRSFSSYIAIAAVSGSLNIWSNNPLNDQNKSIVVHCNNRLAATPTPTPLHAWLAILDTTRARWKHVADNKRLTKRLGEYSGWIHSIQNVPIFADVIKNWRRQGSHIVKVICSCGWKLIARHGNIWYFLMSSDVLGGCCWSHDHHCHYWQQQEIVLRTKMERNIQQDNWIFFLPSVESEPIKTHCKM